MQLTNTEFADMVEDLSIIGKTVELRYTAGPNTEHPVIMEFTGYNDVEDRISYILTNLNTEKRHFKYPYGFSKSEFVYSTLNPDHRHESITIVNGEPEWQL